MEFIKLIVEKTIVRKKRLCGLIIDRCKQGKAKWSHVTPLLELKELND